MQKRMDLLEYRSFTCEKDLKQVMQQTSEAKSSGKPEIQGDAYRGASQTEMMTLRTAISQERDAHR